MLFTPKYKPKTYSGYCLHHAHIWISPLQLMICFSFNWKFKGVREGSPQVYEYIIYYVGPNTSVPYVEVIFHNTWTADAIRPILPNMHWIALTAHFLWVIASSSCKVVFEFTYLIGQANVAWTGYQNKSCLQRVSRGFVRFRPLFGTQQLNS